jgi:hypothetical protein
MLAFFVVAVLWIAAIGGSLRAQTVAPKVDSTAPKLKQIRPGISLPDSLYVARDTVKGDIDTIIRYTAKDSTVFDIPQKRMLLSNSAIVEFEDRELDAYTIVMDFQRNLLTSYSYDFDSVINSSLSVRRRIIRDTTRTKTRGAPKLTEGPTVYEGEVIVYNFKSKRGTVQLGTTEMNQGFYYGEKIKQVAPKTLFVENGRYTTCDAEVPHYYFESPKMKVVMGDQIFAAPVILYVADVPIFVLPFGVFPNHESGRHSGIIPPSYQTQGDRGYGLTHLGYYEVFNDYLDARGQTDIYTVGGYNVDFLAEYNKRYLLNAPATIEYGFGKTRLSASDPWDTNWVVRASLPNLILGYETSLSANLDFESNKYDQNNAVSVQQYLTQEVTSSASFQTGWSDAGVSLGIDYQRSENLNDGEYQEASPEINFSKTTWFPFQTTDVGNPKSLANVLGLGSLGIGYTFGASHNISKNLVVVNNDSTFPESETYSMLHTPTITWSPKVGYFTISPSFSFQDAWLVREHSLTDFRTTYLRDSTGRIYDSVTTADTITSHRFRNLFNYNYGIAVGTTLYGIANIGAFGIEAIRHTIQPSISFTYQPDLSWENYQPIIHSLPGQPTTYNIFEGEPHGDIVGSRKAETLSMSVGNNFDAKVDERVNKDSVYVDHVKLFSLNFSSGYDFVSKYLSPLAVNASSQIGTLFSLSGTAGYSFYPASYTGGDSTAYSLASLHQGLLRPTFVTLGLNGSFSAAKTTEGDNYDSLRRLFHITDPEDERALFFGGYYPGTYIDVPFRPKWNLSYGLSYNQSYSAGGQPTRDFGANVTLSLPLTVNWTISTSASYDLLNRKIVVPELDVHRDLHCWAMDFSYRPPGSAISGFNLNIHIKAPQLQDIKLTRTENTYGEF